MKQMIDEEMSLLLAKEREQIENAQGTKGKLLQARYSLYT